MDNIIQKLYFNPNTYKYWLIIESMHRNKNYFLPIVKIPVEFNGMNSHYTVSLESREYEKEPEGINIIKELPLATQMGDKKI